MPAIDFFKYHGLGNDFILIDALDRRDLLALPWPDLARRWCSRHTGIGADGLLILEPPGGPGFQPGPMPTRIDLSDPPDLRMRIFNADGSEAQMCGNGIRCIAKYMIEHRRWPAPTLHVHTGNGVLAITYELDPAHRMRAATVDMGEPILQGNRIPTLASSDAPSDHVIDHLLTLDLTLQTQAQKDMQRTLATIHPQLSPRAQFALPITAVSMGNPHAVIFCTNISAISLTLLGPAIERHPFFPQRTNVQFLQVQSPERALLRTWERGAGPTRACGTGACAALVAGVVTNRLARAATIHLPGGELHIRWDTSTNHVFMTGPAEEIYRGSLELR